ncbi:MAG: MMPL family transporter [Betaproteobacteria bacterium]
MSLLQRLFRLGLDNAMACVALLLAASLAAGFGLARLSLDTGFERLIPHDDADRQAWLRVTREFGSDNRTFVYVRDAKLWTPEKLAALRKLHDALAELPFVERIESLFTTRSARSADARPQALPILAELPASQQAAEQARRHALADPVGLKNLLSRDGNAVALMLLLREGQAGASTNAALERAVGAARPQLAEVQQIGPPRVEAELRASLLSDLRVLMPLSALILAATVLILYRSVFAAGLPLFTAALSLLWTFGMMGWAGIPVSILCAMLPTLVMVIGATANLRLIGGYYRGLQEELAQGRRADRRAATEAMLRNLSATGVLTVLTTVVGFASNAFSGIPAVRDFGFVAAFAVLSSGLVTVLLVPLLYAAFGPEHGRVPLIAVAGSLSAVAVRAFGVLRQRLALLALALAAVLAVLFVQQASSVYVTNEPLTFLRPEQPLVRSATRMKEELAGVKVFYITLERNAEGSFRDPANLQRLADIQAFIAKQAIFDRSFSLADVLAQANQEAAAGRPDAYRVPPTRARVAQMLLLFPRRDLEPYVSHDFRRANIVVRHSVRDSSTLNRHIRELRQAAAHYAGPEMATSVVGESLMINAAAERLQQGQWYALAALFLVVFLVMSLMFTSLKGGLIALVPSAVPILLMLAVMRVAEIPLNAATVMVGVIAIGVAIDGTLQLFARYSELCRGATSYDEAVLETVKNEAAPVIAVSLALALGFGVLLFSELTLIQQFGALAAATMLFSIFANVLVTPLVMSRIRLVGLYEILAMSMSRDVLEKSPLFRGMTGYQVRKAILISELREYGGGYRVVEQGTLGRSMYLVVSGSLEVVRIDGGQERRLATLGPGDVFGEIGFVRATHRTADVRTLGPVSLLRFDHQRLERDLLFFPHIMAKLNFNISGILGQRLAEVMEQRRAAESSSAGAAASAVAATRAASAPRAGSE